MKSTLFIILLAGLILSACGGAPAATPLPTVTPTAGETAATQAATQPAGQPAGRPVTFKIVPGESRASYEVGETFLNQDNRFNLAIGVTSAVNGEIYADLANPPASTLGEISIDISQFTSDSSRRDNAIRGDWLESSRFPMAVFKPTGIESLPASYVEGQEYAFRVTGDLTVKETTLPVTFDVTAALRGDTLTGKATTTILLSQFGVGPISILSVLKTEDEAKITLEFVARP
ncbi:MAG: YceI family protein [Chloroflexi bacterium]|nr:YceI family protein [Chloroflexota bacterium]